MNSNAIIPVAVVAILNGIFSPWVLAIFVLYPVWYPAWLPQYAQLVYMASSLILSTLTIMAAGVPAALYERLSTQAKPIVVASIWLVGTIMLTLPALPNIVTALSQG